MRRRRYDPYGQVPPPGYPPPGYGWRRGYRGGGSGSCLRDACLLETGCCIGEAITDNCLIAGLLLVPQFLGVALAGVRRPRASAAAASPPAQPAARSAARSATSPAQRPAVRGLVAAIELYQREISAHRPACCRFSPSCSHYAVEALRTHGAARGLLLTARRLVRCRPGGRRGADPVPPPRRG
jgi:uncharacterized protein